MCELLLLSSRAPTNATLSLDELSRHGGATGPHVDGWGVAYYDGRDVRLIRDVAAAADSALLRFVREHAVRSTLVVSHIRKATRGDRCLRNTQPFAREVAGRMHVFAHNGDLSGIDDQPELPLGIDRPVGDTDSEVAFCALLRPIRALWADAIPTVAQRREVVAAFARRIAPLGPANFIYSDGEVAFVHGNRRTQTDGVRRPPGLHVLRRSCALPGSLRAAGLSVRSDGGEQEVVLVASVPLTAEAWEPLAEGEVLAIADGRIVARDRGES